MTFAILPLKAEPAEARAGRTPGPGPRSSARATWGRGRAVLPPGGRSREARRPPRRTWPPAAALGTRGLSVVAGARRRAPRKGLCPKPGFCGAGASARRARPLCRAGGPAPSLHAPRPSLWGRSRSGFLVFSHAWPAPSPDPSRARSLCGSCCWEPVGAERTSGLCGERERRDVPHPPGLPFTSQGRSSKRTLLDAAGRLAKVCAVRGAEPRGASERWEEEREAAKTRRRTTRPKAGKGQMEQKQRGGPGSGGSLAR
ncbi:uncharacterized protein LOC125965445 [Orcinus orca]|uniref:uncharacterized protein LOC125965445 n=1 Tax=Orcinus orca TaxID=9733 RepID=UPI002112F2F2|nr:uncharacterized protein LOC125965445 [Orcinus orca]